MMQCDSVSCVKEPLFASIYPLIKSYRAAEMLCMFDVNFIYFESNCRLLEYAHLWSVLSGVGANINNASLCT